MKTAVSIRDKIFQEAEEYAKKAKISRSQLYSDAIEEYLAKRDEQS
jgi:metal-responsive CopG/Arc/MetJ family transcriptional regulator